MTHWFVRVEDYLDESDGPFFSLSEARDRAHDLAAQFPGQRVYVYEALEYVWTARVGAPARFKLEGV